VNVIFLIVFLAISLPGAVILFRKKLDPQARRMDQPDVITTRLPYMTPLPAPPDVRWIVPDRTRAWLEQLMQAHTRNSRMLSATSGPQWTPIISQDHLVQVMRASESGDSLQVELLIWSDAIEPSAGNISVTVAGLPAKVSRIVTETPPPPIRSELVSLGFIKPPKTVCWIDVLSPPIRNTTTRLDLEYKGSPAPLHTTVEFAVK
jgi:hypothetical protein